MKTPELCLMCSVLAVLLVLAFVPVVIKFATTFGLFDVPGRRKVHSTPVPRLGGLAIALAALIPFTTCFVMLHNDWFPGQNGQGKLLMLVLSSVCMLGMGLIDDLASLPAKIKLLVLLAAAAMFGGAGGLIRAITFGGHDLLVLGQASWVLTALWIIGVTVSINFIDGLDGLASGISLIAYGVLAIGAAAGGQIPILVLLMCVMGALAGFLVFNFNPASVFMGDCGSMFIGFNLAAACVLASQKIGTTRGIILPSLTLAIPILDCALTMIRRGVLHRQSLFAAERGHIHHRLLDIGLIQRHVTLLLWGVTLTAAGVALVAYAGIAWATALAAGILLLALASLFRSAGSVRAREVLKAIRRNRAIQRETRYYQSFFDDLRMEFREVRSFDGWWSQVCRAAERLDFAKMNLPITRRSGAQAVLRWRRDDTELASIDSIDATVPIAQRRTGDALRVEVEVSVSRFLENAGLRLALFSRLMSEFSVAHLHQPGQLHDATKALPHIDRPRDMATPELDPALKKSLEVFSGLRVAIVHDFLYTYAGAERVLEQLVEMFPKADLFSLFDFLPDKLRHFIHRKPVTASFLQKLPGVRKHHRAYLPLMPLAIEQMDVSAYDLVISSSYMVAKGVMTRPDQLHISYCHTPVRFAWDIQAPQLDQPGLLSKAQATAARLILHYIRNWDVRSANNVDVFLTNSDFVGRRIQKYYRRSAQTVYPPVNTDWFTPGEPKENFYLTASRLVPYKRIDLIVEAFNRMPERELYVIGDGPELAALTAKAAGNVHIVGYQPPDRLRRYLQRARAFVFAAEEDFGIAPVEAQACGTPVIAFGRGGVGESVLHMKTGYLFAEQTAESIVKAVEEFERMEWDSGLIRKNAERFSIQQFREKFVNLARSEWARFLAQRIESGRGPMMGAGENGGDKWLPATDVPINDPASAIMKIV